MGEVGKGSTGRTVHKSIYIYTYIYGEVRVLGLVCGGQIGLSWIGEAYTYNRGLIWSGTVGPLTRKDFGRHKGCSFGFSLFWMGGRKFSILSNFEIL